ncbi:hypothetical protein Efla_007498 [Eimeria flavescens]
MVFGVVFVAEAPGGECPAAEPEGAPAAAAGTAAAAAGAAATAAAAEEGCGPSKPVLLRLPSVFEAADKQQQQQQRAPCSNGCRSGSSCWAFSQLLSTKGLLLLTAALLLARLHCLYTAEALAAGGRHAASADELPRHRRGASFLSAAAAAAADSSKPHFKPIRRRLMEQQQQQQPAAAAAAAGRTLESLHADRQLFALQQPVDSTNQQEQEEREGEQQQQQQQEQQHEEEGRKVSALEVAAGVSSPALYAGQAGAASVELMPDTEEQIAMLPNCLFYTSYPGSCIPETSHAPCRYCRAKQYTGQYGAAQCPSVTSFPAELQLAYRWRITPVKLAKKKGYLDEHICVVEKVPGSVPLSPDVLAAAAHAAEGERDLTMLWLVLGIVGITILLATVACLAIRNSLLRGSNSSSVCRCSAPAAAAEAAAAAAAFSGFVICLSVRFAPRMRAGPLGGPLSAFSGTAKGEEELDSALFF